MGLSKEYVYRFQLSPPSRRWTSSGTHAMHATHATNGIDGLRIGLESIRRALGASERGVNPGAVDPRQVLVQPMFVPRIAPLRHQTAPPGPGRQSGHRAVVVPPSARCVAIEAEERQATWWNSMPGPSLRSPTDIGGALGRV